MKFTFEFQHRFKLGLNILYRNMEEFLEFNAS